MDIRFLVPSDVKAYRQLRLIALQESPTSFGSDYEYEAKFTQDQFIARMRPDNDPDNGLFGAFTPMGQLAGMLGITRERGVKRRHGALLWSAYVGASFRRRGIATQLLDTAIAHGRKIGLRHITLAVMAQNEPARKLYYSRGFELYGLQRGELYVDGVYYDQEYLILYLG